MTEGDWLVVREDLDFTSHHAAAAILRYLCRLTTRCDCSATPLFRQTLPLPISPSHNRFFLPLTYQLYPFPGNSKSPPRRLDGICLETHSGMFLKKKSNTNCCRISFSSESKRKFAFFFVIC
jgi:hypothetical protein